MVRDTSGPPLAREPLLLLVRGHDAVAARRWLADWQGRFPDAVAVELGLWDKPHRNTWVNKLNLAIQHAGRPVVVVTEGLACAALVWWAEYERPSAQGPVAGALLIDPPDVDRPGRDPRLAAFPSIPRSPLPFAAVLLATPGRDSQGLRSLQNLAVDWDCPFDTIATQTALAVPSPHPVQSLGQRFLSKFLGLAR